MHVLLKKMQICVCIGHILYRNHPDQVNETGRSLLQNLHPEPFNEPLYLNDYLEIFSPDNHERSDAGFSGLRNKTTFSSFKRCGSSGSESAVISATGTLS